MDRCFCFLKYEQWEHKTRNEEHTRRMIVFPMSLQLSKYRMGRLLYKRRSTHSPPVLISIRNKFNKTVTSRLLVERSEGI